ncbi:hypothetical protein M8C21_025754 [Ambrosia artemisiifolia]|uniref:Uncharacterized protein n=1 Tax=Ambrosia artemisiifolia TaxID=4212 RepID=A0AAD5CYH2_AMBAR|nr:hypothetical protein M8C21_025754 [Ambrosia artemisiifolia]
MGKDFALDLIYSCSSNYGDYDEITADALKRDGGALKTTADALKRVKGCVADEDQSQDVVHTYHHCDAMTLIVGANHVKGMKKSGVGLWLIIGILAVRYVALPIVGIDVVKAIQYVGFVASDSLYVSIVFCIITVVLTDAIKDATGRPRPDFFWHCFLDGIDHAPNMPVQE